MAKKTVDAGKEDLPKAIEGRRIPDVRKVVKQAMERQKLSAYALAKRLAPHITEPTIKNFVDHGKEMTTGKLALLMAVLGLEIRPKE